MPTFGAQLGHRFDPVCVWGSSVQFGLRFVVVPQVALEDYEALTACIADECSEGHSCYTDAGDFYTKDIEGARLIKEGILKGWAARPA